MNNYEKRAFIAASGQVLTTLLPANFDDDNWSSSEYEDIDHWITDHAWEPYENWTAEQLWSQISDVAEALKSFHSTEVQLPLCDR